MEIGGERQWLSCQDLDPPGGHMATEIIVASLPFPAQPKYPKIRPLPPTVSSLPP